LYTRSNTADKWLVLTQQNERANRKTNRCAEPSADHFVSGKIFAPALPTAGKVLRVAEAELVHCLQGPRASVAAEAENDDFVIRARLDHAEPLLEVTRTQLEHLEDHADRYVHVALGRHTSRGHFAGFAHVDDQGRVVGVEKAFEVARACHVVIVTLLDQDLRWTTARV